MQPTYLPWLGYFELINSSDHFVLFDDVQFVKKSWHHRNKIKDQGGELLLSISVMTKGMGFQNINDVKINNNDNWQKKHLNSIIHSYRKAKYFNSYISEIERIYKSSYEFLTDFTIEIINFLKNSFLIDTPITLSSTINTSGKNETKIIEICKHFGANKVYNTQGARNILDMAIFKQNEIDIIFQEYEHPKYNQLHGEFIPYLSALDLLMNEGNSSRKIILQGIKTNGN
jgi:hypothetical protein